MHYIILDLEWNQSPAGKKGEVPGLPFEIIEIGAVKLNEQKQFVDQFHKLIAPAVYKKLHHQICRVLNRTIEDFRAGLSFPDAVREFLDWCGEDFYFCTWGTMDLPELQRNMQYFQIPISFPRPFLYYDIQKLFGIAFEDRKIPRTLEYATDYLSIQKTEPFHNALCDARYAALVLLRLETALIRSNYSIDCYLPPRNRKEEIYAVFGTYSKYISREFDTREKVLSDKEVTSTRCYLCGRPARKKIRWFSSNNRHYFCQCYCENHGWMKGKITIKQSEANKYFAIKILKLVTAEEANLIKQKQELLRKKRRLRRNQKKSITM